MHLHKINNGHRMDGRRGIATLEFAMAMPVLLLLMVAITWLGFSVIGQAEVLVKARNAAWKRRTENLSDKPLIFPLKITIPLMPEYSRAGDFVTETASQTVDVSPIFKLIPGPEANHTVLAGSWDWRAMPLSDPPNWELLGIAAMNGTAGGFQNLLSNLTDGEISKVLEQVAKEQLKKALAEATDDDPKLKAIVAGIESYDDGDWQSMGETIMQTILEDAVSDNEILGTVLEELGILKGGGGSKGSNLENASTAKNAEATAKEKRDAEHAGELNAVVAEIAATQAELDALTNATPPPEPNPPPAAGSEEEKQAQEAKKKAEDAKNQQIAVLKTKLSRLNGAKFDIEHGPDPDKADGK